MCRTSDRSPYVTFDGTRHTIRDTCTYVLLKVCHSTMDLPFFKISGKHGKRRSHPAAFYLLRLNIDISNTRVTLAEGHRVLVSWAAWVGREDASPPLGRGSGPSSHSPALPVSVDQRHRGHPSLDHPDPGGQDHGQWHLHRTHREHRAAGQV